MNELIDELESELNLLWDLLSVLRSLKNELVLVQVLQKRTSSQILRSFVQFFQFTEFMHLETLVQINSLAIKNEGSYGNLLFLPGRLFH